MFDIGFWELMLIALVALVVVGPERLPKLIRVTGLWVGRANASVQSIRSEISRELRAEELKQALNKTVDISDINKLMDVEPKSKVDPVSDGESASDVESTINAEPVMDTELSTNIEPTPEPSTAVKKDSNGNG